MADNVDTKVATNIPVATDVVTYSGDPSQHVQLLRQVHVTGAEDSKTVVDLSGNTGSAVPAAALQIGGSDGTNLRALKLATTGEQYLFCGAVSAANSSVAALGSSAAFTGTAEEVLGYASASIYVFANVASATDGLSIQHSNDGTNWDHVDNFTIPAMTAGQGRVYSAHCAARYLRVVYTNGAGAQATFRLQTVLHVFEQPTSSVRPSDARSNETDLREVLAYGAVFNGTTWDRRRGDTNGAYAHGNIAHDTVESGNPILNGASTIAHGANPTAIAAGRRTKTYANRAGIPFVMGGHPNIQTTRLNFTAAQTDVSLCGTIATGLKVVCTGFQVTLDNASTGFPLVRLGFGATNTPTTTGVIGSHPGVAAGGGFGRGDGSGIIGIGGDGEELRLTTVTAATGGGMDVVVTWYTIES